MGHEARAKKHLLNLDYPVQQGVITDFESIKKIFEHLFNNELRVSPEEHKILITEPPNNPKKNREEIVELM